MAPLAWAVALSSAPSARCAPAALPAVTVKVCIAASWLATVTWSTGATATRECGERGSGRSHKGDQVHVGCGKGRWDCDRCRRRLALQLRAQLSVVVHVLEPKVADFVGDHILHVEQVEQFGARHAFELFAEAPIRLQKVGGNKETEQLVIAFQGQCAAVEAIHRRDAPVEGQVGHQEFLHLLGDDQVGEGLFAQLRWAALQENAAVVGHIPRIVGNGAGA